MKKKIPLNILFLILAAALPAIVFAVSGRSFAFNAAASSGVTDSSNEGGPVIYCDNAPVTGVLLEIDEKKVLTADGLSDGADCAWQILQMDTGTWVNIYGTTDARCGLSYALVKNIIGSGAKTAVRCVVRMDGKVYYSDPVFVTVNLGTEQEADDPVTAVSGTEQETADMETAAAGVKQAASGNTALLMASGAVPAASADEDIVKITVHYQLEDGTQIFSDYIASLQDGSSFSAEVRSPLYVGYAPYILKDGVYQEAPSVRLEYANLHTNVELTVIYRPAMSPYTVRYFLQNVLNDLYTEDSGLKVSGTALTGSYPSGELDKEIPGFTMLFHQPDVVAADGSTEFECYYDRNYYLYNFDCGGGYGVEPVYARYGTSLIIGEPTRTGYKFEGWDLMAEDGSYDGNADTLDSTVGIGNKTYRAIWTAETTTFTIVYWAENANDNGFSYITSQTYTTTSGIRIRNTDLDNFKLTSEIGATYPDGKTPMPYYAEADYLTYDAGMTEQNNPFVEEEVNGSTVKCIHVEGDGSTTLNVVYQRKEYTLKFFYAKSEGTGDNIKYYVVGGSTYYFGNAVTDDEQTMLEAENSVSGVWGQVTAQPELNDRGKARDYTLGSESYNGVSYYYLSFTAKYGSDISELWPVSVFESVTRTVPNTHGNWSGLEAYRSAWNGEYYVKYTQDNLNGNQTIKGIYQKLDSTILYDLKKHSDSDTVRYLCFWENGANVSWSVPQLFIYELYVPVLEGEEIDPADVVKYDGVEYKLYVEPINTYDDSDISAQTASALEGFAFKEKTSQDNPSVNEMKSHTVRFFYTRNSHTLTFSSQNESVFSASVPYEYALKGYADESAIANPPYPSSLEPGAYEFGGWYLAPEGQGTRIDVAATDMTMPDSDLTLYAYWKPVEHTVAFSDTYEKMNTGVYRKEVTVAHGDHIAASDVPVPSPESLGEGAYDFRGWFYINEKGEKQAFSATEMQVTGNMRLFAEWQSTSVVSYMARYCDEDGNKVGEDTTGYSYAGTTRTFVAKAGQELLSEYQRHYYPETNSHSMLMSAEEGKNEYTFVYLYRVEVMYTVRYIAQDTGEELLPAKQFWTDEAVITEKFQFINGYIPDAFYKRCILSANDSENVITFYYTKDDSHAIYAVRHMVEELDGSYSEYAYVEGVGNLEEKISVPPLSIDGFTYDKVKTGDENGGDVAVSEDGVAGTVTADGLEMAIYYKRNEYSYTIQYVEYGNPDNILKVAVSGGKGKFGETISHEPENEVTTGTDTASSTYQLINPENSPRTYVLREDNEVFTVYYRIQMHTINYIAVSNYPGASEFGGVNPVSEQVSKLSDINGSTPTASEGYRFVGWYTDAACTAQVDLDWVDDSNKLTPREMSTEVSNYYALFVPQTDNLTIEKEGVEPADQNQTFLFQITGAGRAPASNISLIVAITGNGSVTVTELPVGIYMVTEITSWSWRYGLGDESATRQIEVKDGGSNTVLFKNISENTTWLGGEASKDNHFQAVTEP